MIFNVKQKIIKLIYVCFDILFLCLAIYLASGLRDHTLPFKITFHNLFIEVNNPYRFVFHFWILITIFLNSFFGLYQTKREIFETLEIWQVIKSTILASLMTIVAIYLLRIESFPRSIMITVTILTSIFFSFWRIGKRIFVHYLVSHGYNNFNVLIVGAGRVGNALANEIGQRPGLGINIVGFLDDFKTNPLKPDGPKIVGKISDFESVARREFVNEVFITIHHDSNAFLQLLESAKELGVAIRVIPQGFDLMSGEFRKYNIGFIPILEYCNFQYTTKQFGKRVFDFFVSLILFLLILPVFVLIGILIKLDSPGPIFYRSRRYGRRGRIFQMFKFRSMVEDADRLLKDLQHKNEVDGPIFKIKEDPRVTLIGKFLRKYSLDELPQIINVLIGDMSLVGPRPFPINQVEKEDVRQLRRLEIRPGITGLWQIRGRSDLSFARLLKWDVWYINNWSFWLDLNILFQTIPVVLKGKGAY